MKLTIKCPECGYEYLPCEIYYPQDLGKATNIVRDMEGKIIYYDGSTIDTDAEYKCDNCNTVFKVDAKISFFTSKDAIKNGSDYVIKLNPNKPKKEIEQTNDLWEDK